MMAKINTSLLLFFGLFFVSATAVKAETVSLQNCAETVCSDVFHDTVLGTATAVVWQGDGDIITSHTFDLDGSAELVHQAVGAVSTESNNLRSSPPPAPCSQGACSEVMSNTHETASEIVTVALTFIYFNGDLIDVEVSEVRADKPS